MSIINVKVNKYFCIQYTTHRIKNYINHKIIQLKINMKQLKMKFIIIIDLTCSYREMNVYIIDCML